MRGYRHCGSGKYGKLSGVRIQLFQQSMSCMVTHVIRLPTRLSNQSLGPTYFSACYFELPIFFDSGYKFGQSEIG